jgi:hypothetical protein
VDEVVGQIVGRGHAQEVEPSADRATRVGPGGDEDAGVRFLATSDRRKLSSVAVNGRGSRVLFINDDPS